MTAGSGQLYLLDANVLIDAHNRYYAIDMVPEFWEWLFHTALAGYIAIPLEIFEELQSGSDPKRDLLNEWLVRPEIAAALVLEEDFNVDALNTVVTAYAPNLTDSEIEQVGRDPFLIAYGLMAQRQRIVVSNEVSKPSKIRANKKVPDVCREVGVRCCDAFTMLRALGFRTGWAA